MSIHAQLSPEAQAALAAQKRTSTISALIISILSFGLVILILMVIALTVNIKSPPEIISYSSGVAEDEQIDRPKTTSQVVRKPSSPSSSMAKVIASSSASPTAVPVPSMDISEVALDFGNGDDFGDGWGDNGAGSGGGGFGSLPATMKKRCSKQDRLARLLANGGNEKCEEAVMKSLRWLQKTQNSDGSWDKKYKGAMTGFALLAFLGHCETPTSVEFGETVEKAIVYLVNLGMENDGRLATASVTQMQWVYEHGIATYALAEAYTFCDSQGLQIPNLAEATKTAGDMIIKGQTDSGGWLYKYAASNGGDNSVGFWQIQALKACKNTKMWADKDFKTVSRKALEWLTEVQGSNGAIGYRNSPTRSPGLTGGGVLAFQMWNKSNAKAVRQGIKYIRANTKFDWEEVHDSNLYYHYYNAQAMINYGGKNWEFYNELFRDKLLENQDEDGSWTRVKYHNHGSNGQHMATCLATFMLEVYYRFLPSSAK